MMTQKGAYKFSPIPDGPQMADRVYNGMRVADDLSNVMSDCSFIDRRGRVINIPAVTRRGGLKPIASEGYCKAVWDFKNGDLLLSEDNRTLYVRDVDRSGKNQLLPSWHAISTLENEYHVPGRDAYSPWNDQLRVEASKQTIRVRHGIKFADKAFLRFNGKVVDIDNNSPYFNDPFEVTLDSKFDYDLAEKAMRFLFDVTVDEKSAANLCRMFATPLLEDYKHLTYVLYGDGGNGKGILLNTLASSLPGLTSSVDSQKILGGRRGSGGFDTQQEMGKLIGSLWAFDEDADTITLDQLTALKKISTGDSVTARRIQENAVSFIPRCTFIIATNNPVITAMSNAIYRRFVYVRMKDNRKPAEFADLLEFRKTYGVAPFLMASCLLWSQQGNEPHYDVSIGAAADLSEAEQWLVDTICAQGYAVSGVNPFKPSAREHKSSVSKLGLKSTVKWINGASQRVLMIANKIRFAPYREAWQLDQKALEEELEPVEIPVPLADVIPVDTVGFECDYVPAGEDKTAINWKQNAEDPTVDTSIIPDTPAYGVVPREGYIVIDMDMPKEDGEDSGWLSLQLSVGAYGSLDFPRTYLVKTPSGGVHAYYRLPQALVGHVKNAVGVGGYHIDLRVDGKGYVIGAGSQTKAGVYELCDIPNGDTVPELSMALVRWLNNLNCVTQPQTLSMPTLPASATIVTTGDMSPLSQLLNKAYAGYGENNTPPVDMSPVPKGARNQVLHDWAFGRLVNHRENAEQIFADLMERARISELPEREVYAMWKSICRQVGI